MAGGSLQLYEYPGPMVRLACSKCGRSGQYRKQNLIEEFGPDVRLPDLNCPMQAPWDARRLNGALRRADAQREPNGADGTYGGAYASSLVGTN
jgi:hypothetical protein